MNSKPTKLELCKTYEEWVAFSLLNQIINKKELQKIRIETYTPTSDEDSPLPVTDDFFV